MDEKDAPSDPPMAASAAATAIECARANTLGGFHDGQFLLSLCFLHLKPYLL